MPFPMLSKETIGNIEKTVGLPLGLIRELDVNHTSFYLQNKKHMNIERRGTGDIEYVLKSTELIMQYYVTRPEKPGFKGIGDIFRGRVILNETEFDNFLNRIDFRGSEIKDVPLVRYIRMEEIDKEIDKICKKA